VHVHIKAASSSAVKSHCVGSAAVHDPVGANFGRRTTRFVNRTAGNSFPDKNAIAYRRQSDPAPDDYDAKTAAEALFFLQKL
jgi:hypothetical protein